jgi:hypothetical protein
LMRRLALIQDPVSMPGQIFSIDLTGGQSEPKMTVKQDNLREMWHFAATTWLTKNRTIWLNPIGGSADGNGIFISCLYFQVVYFIFMMSDNETNREMLSLSEFSTL